MNNKKMVVGMSGGVDSSVAAYLLKAQGYDVIGVTMQTFLSRGETDAISDAKAVADRLGIEHHVIDFRDAFRGCVIDNFIAEYIGGNTPNPCVRCNRHVKWEALLELAGQFGAEYIVTGHYAKILKLDNGRYAVCKADHDNKDQAYVLYNLTQEQLAHTIMPLGEYSKDEIREMAKKIGLSVADKPDSQDICFIPDNDYAGFIAANTKVPGPGNFVDTESNVLGRHEGIHKYTVGQRKGLNIALGRPVYVCEIRPDTDEVVLGDNEDVFTDEVFCNEVNHMAVDNFLKCEGITAKVRYSGKDTACSVEYIAKDIVKCRFHSPVRAATPGQALVFYKDNVVLGGGIIRRAKDVMN